jgi:outer membrane protein TolC
MSNSSLVAELRQKAIETLRESTEMFERAFKLLKAGDIEQAEAAQEMARVKRTDSAWLMNEANRRENESAKETF